MSWDGMLTPRSLEEGFIDDSDESSSDDSSR